NRHCFPFAVAVQRDMTSSRCKLQRIGEKVQYDLLQLRRVSVRDNRIIAAGVVVFQFPLLELGADETFHLAQNLVDDRLAEVDFYLLSAIETSEIENSVDQPQQMLLALLNAAQVAQLRFVEWSVYLALEQFGVAKNRLQWS